MSVVSCRIAAEEVERVEQVGEVVLDRDVVHPWRNSVGKPFRVDGGFEDDGVGRD